jgi:hypothetical protein
MLFVGGIYSFKDQASDQAASHVGGEVDPNVRGVNEFHRYQAEGDGGVEGAAGDATDGEGASHHRHADGQSVEGIAGVAFGGGGVEDDVGEGEGEEEFGDQRGGDVFHFHRFAGADQEHGGGGCEEPGGDLRNHVRSDVFGLAFAAGPDGEGDGGVVVRGGNVAAGENHDHESGADGERRDDAGGPGDDRATDCENQKKCPDEFGYVFVHK